MAFQAHNFVLDAGQQLKDAGAVTADGAGTVSAAAAVFDLGAANAYARFAVVIDWTAIDITTGDEAYDIQVQGAAASNFATPYILVNRKLGDSTVTLQPVDTAPSGRLVLFGDNVAMTSATDGSAEIATRYIRVYHDVAGTTPSINYTAFIVPVR